MRICWVVWLKKGKIINKSKYVQYQDSVLQYSEQSWVCLTCKCPCVGTGAVVVDEVGVLLSRWVVYRRGSEYTLRYTPMAFRLISRYTVTCQKKRRVGVYPCTCLYPPLHNCLWALSLLLLFILAVNHILRPKAGKEEEFTCCPSDVVWTTGTGFFLKAVLEKRGSIFLLFELKSELRHRGRRRCVTQCVVKSDVWLWRWLDMTANSLLLSSSCSCFLCSPLIPPLFFWAEERRGGKDS